MAVPWYVPYHFDTIEDFNEYIENPAYKTNNEYKGVCFALQHWADEDAKGPQKNYTFSLHYPDKSVGLKPRQYAKGVPNQEDPVYLPYAGAPDLLSYVRY